MECGGNGIQAEGLSLHRDVRIYSIEKPLVSNVFPFHCVYKCFAVNSTYSASHDTSEDEDN